MDRIGSILDICMAVVGYYHQITPVLITIIGGCRTVELTDHHWFLSELKLEAFMSLEC
jgi:hypothetical protein